MIKKLLLFSVLVVLTIFMSPNLKSNQQIVLNSETKQLSAPSGISYTWFYNGVTIENKNSRNLKVTKSGKYTVQYTTLAGETRFQTIMVQVDANGVHKLLLIGDSTCSEYDSDSYPRTGWGQVLQPFFNGDSVRVYDYALSGRSSKSFYTDRDGWPKVMPKITEGDFLFIQFGHNDEKTDEERHTDPYTTFQDYLSIYIDTALARGAYPVLLTSIERNGWSGTSLKYSHGEYPAAMRQLAVEKGIPLIDLTEKTHVRLEAIGEDYVTNNIFMNIPAGIYSNYPEGRGDNTHLQEEGAWEICKLVKEGITEQKDTTTLGILYNNMNSAGFIKVLSDPYLAGTFSGKGVISTGRIATIKANPSSGYAIAKWRIDETIVSTEREYTYTVADTMLFMRGVFETGYAIKLYRTSGGAVSGAGSYLDNSEITVYASPYEGYEFKGWVDANADTVEKDTAMTITLDGADVRFKAIFQEIPSAINSFIDANLKIFPNPASDKIHLEASNEISRVQLLDLSGRILQEERVNSKTYTLPLNLPVGIHLLHLTFENTEITRKIFIE